MPPRKELPGNLVRIALGPSKYGYGRVLDRGFIEIFDVSTDAPSASFDRPLRTFPVLFTVCVHKSWSKREGWEVIGRDREDLRGLPTQFMQDLGGGALRIVLPDGSVRGGTRDEVLAGGIERLAVWEDEHVEDRLRDHFAGRPCKWTEQLLPR